MKNHCSKTQENDFIVPYPADQPDVHGFQILGKETTFVSHFMMMTMVDHQYQVIMEVELGEAQKELYLKDLKEYPNKQHVLANSDTAKMILPDIGSSKITDFPYGMYRGVPVIPSQHAVLLANGHLKIKRLIAFRHFDMGYNGIYTPSYTYYLYGKGNEAHMSHFVSIGPALQHELSLKEVPSFLSPEELERGVLVTFPELFSVKGGKLPQENPLPEGEYQVTVRGKKGLHTINVGKTLWFDIDLINGKEEH